MWLWCFRRWISDSLSVDVGSGGHSSLLYGAGHRSEDAFGQHRGVDGHQPVSEWTGWASAARDIHWPYSDVYVFLCSLQAWPALWRQCICVFTTTSSTPGASGISFIHFRWVQLEKGFTVSVVSMLMLCVCVVLCSPCCRGPSVRWTVTGVDMWRSVKWLHPHSISSIVRHWTCPRL